ncbi:MAG: 50S ribosomal protein L10, partial [Hyphomicrobium sp.]
MDRAAKRELISSLHDELKSTGVVVVAHNTGMVAAQSADFRKRVKEAGGSVRVAKNTLAKLAFKDTDADKLTDLMKGPTILAYSKDPIAAAKAAVTYAKGNDKLVILGGAMGKTILDAKGVKALAELP